MTRIAPRLAILLALLLASLYGRAQTYGAIQNYCTMGGVSAITQGLPSTNKLLGIVPSCTVTVYLTGTQTIATIYSDPAGDPLSNPFTSTTVAGTAPGQWIFWVPSTSSQAYDVVLSGGIPPNVYHAPVTLTGVSFGGGGGGSHPPTYSVQFALANGAFGSDSCITINPTAHSFTVCGSGNGIIKFCGQTSGLCVTETVPSSTAAYTWTIPGAPPGANTGINCMTTYSLAGNAPSAWTGCDGAPFNPTGSTTYVSGTPMPPGPIKATDYGVLCNGSNDDYPALQALANAPTRVVGVLQAPPQPMVSGVIQLPQGHCLLSHPLVLLDYGSIEGEGNGTWVGPAGNWTAPAGSALINIAQSFNVNNYLNQIGTSAGRFVKDINFSYNASASQITAVKVYNQTGTSTTPYPATAGNNAQPFQIPDVTLQDLYAFAMDTGYDLEDCGNCTLINLYADAVRQGVVDGGNNYSLEWFGGNLLDGRTTYTPVSGNTYGISAASEARWQCVGGTGTNCTGGTITQTLVVSPQTFMHTGVTVESFTYDGYIASCLNYIASANGFDAGGIAGLYLGPVKFANVYDNFMATNTGDGIQLAAVTSTQGSGISNSDGVWIYANQIYSYQNSTGSGINFLSGGGTGSNARRNVYIKDNQLSSFGIGVNVQSPLTYSLLTGNYGNSISGGEFFNFPVTAAGSYAQTSFHDNTCTSPIPVYTSTTGNGLIVGYNSCGNPTFGGQLTGTQIASGPGCTTGASIGATCTGSPAVITIPNQYLDTNYSVTGCQVIGATGVATVGLIVKTNGAQFGAYETSLSSGGVSGGTIFCTVNDK